MSNPIELIYEMVWFRYLSSLSWDIFHDDTYDNDGTDDDDDENDGTDDETDVTCCCCCCCCCLSCIWYWMVNGIIIVEWLTTW